MPDHFLSINPFVGISHLQGVQAYLCQQEQDVYSMKGANGAKEVRENDDTYAGIVSLCPTELTTTELARLFLMTMVKWAPRYSLQK